LDPAARELPQQCGDQDPRAIAGGRQGIEGADLLENQGMTTPRTYTEARKGASYARAIVCASPRVPFVFHIVAILGTLYLLSIPQ
jgi:hypothetical protein